MRRRHGVKLVWRRREEDERGRGLSLLVAVCVRELRDEEGEAEV